jgi:hypothetical protein
MLVPPACSVFLLQKHIHDSECFYMNQHCWFHLVDIPIELVKSRLWNMRKIIAVRHQSVQLC